MRARIRDQHIVAPAGLRVPLRNMKYRRAQLRDARRFRPSFADHVVFDAAGSNRILGDARLDRITSIYYCAVGRFESLPPGRGPERFALYLRPGQQALDLGAGQPVRREQRQIPPVFSCESDLHAGKLQAFGQPLQDVMVRERKRRHRSRQVRRFRKTLLKHGERRLRLLDPAQLPVG